jgi:hypothetical protein
MTCATVFSWEAAISVIVGSLSGALLWPSGLCASTAIPCRAHASRGASLLK